MHRPNPRPFFPGLLPKSCPRSCSSHARPSCTFSRSRTLPWLGVCFLFSSSLRTYSTASGSYTRCAPFVHTPPAPLKTIHWLSTESPVSRSSFTIPRSVSAARRDDSHRTTNMRQSSAASPSSLATNTPNALASPHPSPAASLEIRPYSTSEAAAPPQRTRSDSSQQLSTTRNFKNVLQVPRARCGRRWPCGR